MNKIVAKLLANEVTVNAVIEMIMHIDKSFDNYYDNVKKEHFINLLVGEAEIKTISDLDCVKIKKLFKEQNPNIIEIENISYDVDNINMLVTVKADVRRFGFFKNQEDSKYSWKASTKSDAEHPYRAEYNDNNVTNAFAFDKDIWIK